MADDSLTEISTLDVSKLKVPDLKKELKNRGLSSTGNKNELVERLQAALKSSDTANVDSIDDIEEDLLNDDDDEHLDESESVINELDNDLDDSPKTQKRKISDTDKPEVTSGPTKKVILKRNNSECVTPTVKNDTNLSVEKKVNAKMDGTNIEDKKVIKFSDLSAKERLEMRAKKFGVTELSGDVKKLVRAERFSANKTSSNTSAASIKLSNSDTNIDVLKQRAARFGVSTSSVMSNLEKKEKLEKRKERFGGTTTESSNGKLEHGKSSTDLDKAKAARLERFKQTVYTSLK